MTENPSYSHFFGYGSLVNLATHSYDLFAPARVTGWRRAWQHYPEAGRKFLTVRPDAGTVIDGIVASISPEEWQNLDAREVGYDRHIVTHQTDHRQVERPELILYAMQPEGPEAKADSSPIILSYLDVVVQGYLKVFGEAGVSDFFATTDGWDAPVLDDRAAPQYPRSQLLSADETALVDDHLSRLSAVVEKL